MLNQFTRTRENIFVRSIKLCQTTAQATESLSREKLTQLKKQCLLITIIS